MVIFRIVSMLASVGWMAAVCLGTAQSADPLWALTAFRRVVPTEGYLLLGAYLGWSVLFPLVGMWCIVVTFARFLRHHTVLGAITGVCAGIYLDYLQFALPFAGEISNVPGLPAALVLYGNERLSAIWALAFCINIAFYAVIGSVLGIALGRCGLGASEGETVDLPVGQRKRNVVAVRRVAGGLMLSVLLLILGLWPFGNGAAGVDGLLAQFDVARGVRLVRDITYDRPGGVDLKLDLCKPARPDDSRLPAVVCIHGGGWRGGMRSEYVPLIVQLARRAYVAITIDYRLAPMHRFPAQAEDVGSAIRWLRQHADEYGVDPDNIGLLGWSAGGHLACFVGVAGSSTESCSGKPCDATGLGTVANVHAVVSFSGLTDLTADYWDVIPSGRRALIGSKFDHDPGAYRAASPVAHVNRNAPPFLLLHGVADPVVPLDQAQRFRDALQAVGRTVPLREYDGQGHRWFGSALSDANREALAFFDHHLKGHPGAFAAGATKDGSG